MATKKAPAIYQFKVELLGYAPAIWRRLQTPSDITLGDFHFVLQDAMGWQDYHLHEFELDDTRYVDLVADDLGENPEEQDEDEFRLQDLFKSEGQTMNYLYDFGDDWQHAITLEKIFQFKPDAGPVCLEGEMNCPPEDVGGVHGYAATLEALADPSHPEHKEKLAWRGPLNPEYFNLEDVNYKLRRRFRVYRR